jgi:aminobenzoyl-glutamate utilization protein B
MHDRMTLPAALSALLLSSLLCSAQTSTPQRLDAMRSDLLGQIDSMKKQAQVMNDMVFSFAELGFHETETSAYLAGILEKEGFQVERGIAGIPTAWVASWGSGKPVISLASDIDCIPQASQKPGVAYHDPLIAGAPGHGEGHNSGMPMNIVAAIAVKRLMQGEHLPGTLRLWPGVAEEQLGSKAHYVRAGVFKDVDVVLFAHVSDDFSVSWGEAYNNSGLVSVEYQFAGESAHAAAAPWRGRSALDAVELMDVGWNFRREHLRLQQRSHYVITDGGDQPNVVPQRASVWYYFRELDYQHILDLWKVGDDMARGATLMTGTTVTSRVLGSAWPTHFNKPVAEAMMTNIKQVGLPQWSEADQTLARALQKELNADIKGLPDKIEDLKTPLQPEQRTGGGSDDIGDVSWAVPTVTLRYPANIPSLPGHNWANAIAMATPIAHKGVVAGAKAMALTVLDLLTRPELVKSAWEYFNTVQTKEIKYRTFLRPEDKPAVFLNEKQMEPYREQLRKFYYQPDKYDTYLQQLGITYPTVRK